MDPTSHLENTFVPKWSHSFQVLVYNVSTLKTYFPRFLPQLHFFKSNKVKLIKESTNTYFYFKRYYKSFIYWLINQSFICYPPLFQNYFPKVNYFSVTEQKLMMMLMSSLITILYITSVGRASHGNQERHKMIDSDTYSQPEFGPAPNLTRVQVDSTAFLHCNVLHLEEDNQASFPRQTGQMLTSTYTYNIL